jgi:hypothetical protein
MFASRFYAFIPWILKWETEFQKGHDGDDNFVRVEHDPADPGGTTKYGIDARAHPKVDIANLTKITATEIYLHEWVAEGCEAMPPGLGEAYYNAAVNCGVNRAKRLLAVSQGRAKYFIDAQKSFYQRLANARPIDKKYLVGWDNRLDDLKKYLKI